MSAAWQRSLKKAVVPRLLPALLLLTLIPSTATTGALPAGAVVPQAAASGEKPLEEAVRAVKAGFNIPPELSRFTSSYNSWGNRPAWALTWEGTGASSGRIYAEVDATTEDILSFNVWPSQPKPGPRLPSISLAVAEQAAGALVDKLLADRVKDLRLVPGDDQLVPLNSYGPVVYNVRWQRYLNGTPVGGDGVTVGVSADDGNILSYRLQWSRAAYPAATGAVGPSKAREAFDQTGMFELQYFMPGPSFPMAAGKKPEVLLVYNLAHPSGGVIDAFTGEPAVLQSDMWYGSGGADGMGGGMASRTANLVAAEPTPLTPEELAEIEKTAKLISRDEAIAVVRKWVDIPASLTLRGYSLSAHWLYPNIRMWNLNWNSDTYEPGQVNYLSAQIDAVTGELMGFDLGAPTDPGAAAVLDREEARKLAEDFLDRVQPDKMKQTRLVADRPQPLTPTKQEAKPRAQYFTYRRLVDGIPFPANSLTVNVDTVTKQITHFGLNWADYEFPKATGVLTPAQAVEAFLAARPLTLTYLRVIQRNGEGEGRLVYEPIATPATPSSTMLDARTGEPLDGRGRPLAGQPRARRFTDIAGNFAEYEIGLLGRAGLFGEYGQSFRPAEKISAVSLLRAMLMAKDGLQQSELSDDEVLAQAKQRGWVTGDLAPTALVTREMLAKLMVRLLGLDQAARVEGIYRVPYSDASSIAPTSFGYVAIAWGLGVVTGDGRTFAGNQPVTRAEAAAALVRTIRAVP